MIKRSRLQIYFDVLEAISRGIAKPTKIMYETNLSWNTLCTVFNVLIDSDFMQEEKKKNTKRYHITHKGKKALSYYRRSVEGLGTLPVMT